LNVLRCTPKRQGTGLLSAPGSARFNTRYTTLQRVGATAQVSIPMTDKNLGKTGADHREQSPIITNSAINAGRLFFGTAVGLVSSAVVARSLGKFEMGRYAYAVWIMSLLVSIAHGGIPTTLTRFVAEATARDTGYSAQKLVVRLLTWQVALALLVCLAACVVLAFVQTIDRVLYLLAILRTATMTCDLPAHR